MHSPHTRHTAGSGPDRSGQLARFYAAHRDALRRLVAHQVGASAQTIEDACQNAWVILVRRREIPLDERGVAWLTTVAVHEAWRLARPGRELPAGAISQPPSAPGELPDPPAPGPDPADRVLAAEHHTERVRALAALKPRERRDLFLHAAGYSYQEIAAAAGCSYTAVNRRLTEGRAQLRRQTMDRPL